MARPALAPEIHEASGAYVKDPQRRPKDIPKYIPGAPEMPAIVAENEQASWYWNWCCKVLDEAGVLTTACLPLLTVHSLDWAQCMWLYSQTKEGNVCTLGAAGQPVISPEAAQLHQFANRILKELNEFGLTPASKSKVIATKKEGVEDPFAEMLKRRMGGPSKN